MKLRRCSVCGGPYERVKGDLSSRCDRCKDAPVRPKFSPGPTIAERLGDPREGKR